MDILRIIKKGLHVIITEPLGILLIGILIGYLTLFIAFIVVFVDSHRDSNSDSDWYLENFQISIEPKTSETKTLNHFYSKLLQDQQTLGQEFEKVLNENLWHLYES